LILLPTPPRIWDYRSDHHTQLKTSLLTEHLFGLFSHCNQ
jgi:hypothetical protein